MNWPAVVAAQAHDPVGRVPFAIAGRVVGSVSRAHLPGLRGWPSWLAVEPERVHLVADLALRDVALARISTELHAAGLLRGWRDERVAVTDLATGAVLARVERAAARFWGTLTVAAHANGFVVDAQGRPAALWIARRSLSKDTDPGMLDNLVGGGVPWGQTPHQALLREAWEEAGMSRAELTGLRPGRVIRLCRDAPDGLRREQIHCYDLELPAGRVPVNQDGEVAGFELVPVEHALARAAGNTMAVDAALVTLDFALRHGLVNPPPEGAQALFSLD